MTQKIKLSGRTLASHGLICLARLNSLLKFVDVPKFSNLNRREFSLARSTILALSFADPRRRYSRPGLVRASTSPETAHPRLRAENPGIDHQTRAIRRCADRRTCHCTDLPDRVRRARFIAGGYRAESWSANSHRIASR